jgi:tRNA nucleotidyltransferase (CCA-adding enzyme)
MKVYLVGGAVRDEQLGVPVKERDWCVVGATPEDLEALGYRQVGRDFPVFLHPESGEEYALARTERKTAAGYHGFQFLTSPDISIEDDLGRRDLTINAMAMATDGNDTLIDPYGGLQDLHNGVLRHVSDAFAEDPVRILRVAKFASRFAARDFQLAPETLALMRHMVDNGEADALVAERVWKETEEALRSDNPQEYFSVLERCGALRAVFPEIAALFGVPQPPQHHPEIDCGIHTLMVLQQAAILSDDPVVRFAALVHDLGKATTAPELLPSHHGHERRSMKLVKSMAKRLAIPQSYRDLGMLVAEYHGHCHRAMELRADTILRVLERSDAFRRPQRFSNFLLACEADARGRTGLEERPYPQADYLRGAYAAAAGVSAADIAAAGGSGADIGRQLQEERTRAISDYVSSYTPPPK